MSFSAITIKAEYGSMRSICNSIRERIKFLREFWSLILDTKKAEGENCLISFKSIDSAK